MGKKWSPTIGRAKLPVLAAILPLLLLWQGATMLELVPAYMLPSPYAVVLAFYRDAAVLGGHLLVTLEEALLGLGLGVVFGFLLAVLMDSFSPLYRGIYPLLVISQTIPTVAIAPLLVLWFGYEMTPKVLLVALVTFFPMTVGLLGGFRAAPAEAVALLRSMGADRRQVFRYLKCPAALPQFFSALRISTAYAVVGAVISEWLGGFSGLGVYMTRVKKAFAFDKMFAVIFLISGVSLLLMALVSFAERRCMPYRHCADSAAQEKGETP